MSDDNKQKGSEETYKCAKCGKEKKKDQGSFVLHGSAFCCEDCCKRGEKKDDKVCEFC